MNEGGYALSTEGNVEADDEYGKARHGTQRPFCGKSESRHGEPARRRALVLHDRVSKTPGVMVNGGARMIVLVVHLVASFFPCPYLNQQIKQTRTAGRDKSLSRLGSTDGGGLCATPGRPWQRGETNGASASETKGKKKTSAGMVDRCADTACGHRQGPREQHRGRAASGPDTVERLPVVGDIALLCFACAVLLHRTPL